MSEFKFACPVCGQHITADTHAGGSSLECPTCYQNIVVPHASGRSKFILSAAKASKRSRTSVREAPAPRPRKPIPWAAIALLVALAGVASAGVVLVKKWRSDRPAVKPGLDSPPGVAATADASPPPLHPVPTNVSWTMALSQAVMLEGPVAGRIQGSGFRPDRAILQGGLLLLREGKGWPPDLAVSIQFPAKHGEELSGKSVEVIPGQAVRPPRVILRWKNQAGEARHEVFNGSYLLRLGFGKAANQRIPGKLYLALPDANQSFITGSFEAEIKPPPKKRPAPKPAS